MLYIFHVETGTMMTFDMNYALDSVTSLKTMIEQDWQIPANKQVLLVSGGEVLRPDAKVYSYSAGTDTNPIYMFSKTIIESDEPPKAHHDYGLEVNFREQLEKCFTMSPSTGTVAMYTQIAQKFREQARDHIHACEKLVHEQHLQQQGWAAVVANMEDVTKDFCERAEDFESKFNEQLNKKDEYAEFLNRFNDDLKALSTIPILPALRLNAVSHPFTAFDELHGDSESYDDSTDVIEEGTDENTTTSGDSNKASGSAKSDGDDDTVKDTDLVRRSQVRRSKTNQNNKEALTLLHWITIKENQESLKHIAEYCQKAMEMFDTYAVSNIRLEVESALKSANQLNMKNINGLEKRLSGLGELMNEARKIEQEQKEMANAFLKQKTSVSINDMSILRLICESLLKQLQSMFKNHQKLSDIRRRCVSAKIELSANLYHRLQWIVYVENRMFETDSKLMFYHRSLARLKRHLVVVEQLHRAPSLFCTAVHEIVRRRTFSQAFLTWASELARHLLTIHSEEVKRRREFHNLFSGHFLGDLFPGTNDMPPAYGTQTPKVFDVDLPKLTQSDIESLNTCLPHLSPEIPPSDITPVVQFFKHRPEFHPNVTNKPQKDEKKNVATKEDRGCESETDTEEFEKVGQSPIERGGGAAPNRTDATTVTEDNMDSKRNEVDSMKETMGHLYNICSQSINVLKTDLSDLKIKVCDERSVFSDRYKNVQLAWENYVAESTIHEREALQRLTVDHELEMNDIKQTLISKDEKILLLQENILKNKKETAECVDKWKSEINEFSRKIKSYESQISEQNKKLNDAESSKTTALKELQDRLALAHKTEVESLRSRFRLVTLTSMDRSPSESSLEKIERTDMIEISNHNAILMQTQVNMEEKKEEAIKNALKIRDLEWGGKLEDELNKIKLKHDNEKQIFSDSVKRILEEKDRQLEQYRERILKVEKDCTKYRGTIQQLMDPEVSNISIMQSKLDEMLAEKRALEEKLKLLLSQPISDLPSISKIDTCTATDPPSRIKMVHSHTPLRITPKTLKVSSCSPNDVVLVMWDGAHNNYTILQESNTLHLLHNDSLDPLGLKIHLTDECERRLYAVGVVEKKELCNAVKPGNKYQMALGQKFFRVKVKPVPNPIRNTYYCCEPPPYEEIDSSQKKTEPPSKSSRIREPSMSESTVLVQSMVTLPQLSEDERLIHARDKECASTSHDKSEQCYSRQQQQQPLLETTVETIECVPYSNEMCAGDDLPPIDSEVAEEASP